MRSPTLGILTCLGLAVCTPAWAQGEPAPAAASANSADAVETAIARWQRAAAAGGPSRFAALSQLAALDDERVTAVLLAELERAGADPFAMRVVEAIGSRPRANVVEPLLAMLQRERVPLPQRNALAKAIALQGNRGIDQLLDLARADGGDAQVRQASRSGLAAVDDERAWRGLAPLALKGSVAERLEVLRLLAPARGVAAVTQARLRLLADTDALLLATAWHQLAAEGHAKARSALDDVLERVGQSPAPPVRAEIVRGMGLGMPADAYREFVRIAAAEGAAVRTAVREVAPELGKDAAFVRFLLQDVVASKLAIEREVALAILAKAPTETLQPLVERIRAGLAKPTQEGLELALALGGLLAKDARWPDDVRRLIGASDPALRTAGFALLFDLDAGNAIEQAQRNVNAKEWELRSVAYRYLTKFRALSSIPVLIARVEKEEGRLDGELNNALFALTGVRCWKRAEWEAWWRKHQKTHVLPAAETVAAAGKQGGGSTVAYYGIPLTSKRTIFLLDISGSMQQPIGTDRKRTRLSEAARQLRNVVASLPEDQLFNVMAYSGTVTPVFDAMRKATAEQKKAVTDLIDQVRTGPGGTNIHDALELAFADGSVDTIYLLSDGDPTAGKIVDANELADAVRRWNYQRQIVVHCVAVGANSPLLQRLAQESGGQYVLAR